MLALQLAGCFKREESEERKGELLRQGVLRSTCEMAWGLLA